MTAPAADPFTGIAGLVDLPTWATPEESRLAAMLLAEGQHALFHGWRVGEDVEKKRAFFLQVTNLEKGYPGGVAAYLNNARKLLRSSAAGDNPFEGMRPEVRAVLPGC